MRRGVLAIAVAAQIAGASLSARAAQEPPAEAPFLRPSATAGLFWIVPRREGQFGSSAQPGLAVDASVELYGHVSVGVGYLRTLGQDTFPELKLLAAKVGYLFLAGSFTPYVTAGFGYLDETILFRFDEGTPGSGSGGAAVFEAGLLLQRWPGFGRVALSAQAVLPTFSVQNRYVQPERVRVPFYLVGIKAGF